MRRYLAKDGVKKPLADPNMFKWLVHFYKGDGSDDQIEQAVGVHKCNNDDYKDFYKPSEKSRPVFDDIKEKNEFFCLDDID